MMKKMKPPYHYSLTPVPLSGLTPVPLSGLTPVPLSKGEGSDMLSG